MHHTAWLQELGHPPLVRATVVLPQERHGLVQDAGSCLHLRLLQLLYFLPIPSSFISTSEVASVGVSIFIAQIL